MKTIGWIIYVDDGSKIVVCRSDQTSWEKLPLDGWVECMIYKEGCYRESLMGYDHYFKAPHRDGDIYASSNDTIEEIQARYPGAVVRRGKWVPNETLELVRNMSVGDSLEDCGNFKL